MSRSSERSYYTYNHVAVRALYSLNSRGNGAGRLYHTATLIAEIRELSQHEALNLRPAWTKRVAVAARKLVDEGVLVRAGGRTGLSDTAKTRLSESKKRFGPFESLSPFKRSQFLKTVVGKAPPKRASTRQSRRKTVSLEQFEDIQKRIETLQRELENEKAKNKALERSGVEQDVPGVDPAHDAPGFEDEDDEMQVDRHLSIEPEDPAIELTQLSSPTVTLPSPPRIGLQTPTRTSSQTLTPPPTEPRPQRPPFGYTHLASGSFISHASQRPTPSPSPSPSPNPLLSPADVFENHIDVPSVEVEIGGRDSSDDEPFVDNMNGTLLTPGPSSPPVRNRTEGKLRRLQVELQQKNARLEQLQHDNKHYEVLYLTQDRSLAEETKKNKQLLAELDSWKAKHATIEAEFAISEVLTQEARTARDYYMARTSELQGKLQRRLTELRTLELENRDLKSKLECAEVMLDGVDNKLRKGHARLRRREERTDKEVEELRRKLKETRARAEHAEGIVDGLGGFMTLGLKLIGEKRGEVRDSGIGLMDGTGAGSSGI